MAFDNETNPSYEVEHNFFKLMHFLTKNCKNNAPSVRDIKVLLENYKNEIVKNERADISDKISKIIKEAE